VTLFKRNYAHVFPEQYFKMYRTVSRGNPNYFITYGNGKSAARVQSGLRPNGAHRWFNYYRAPKCAPVDRHIPGGCATIHCPLQGANDSIRGTAPLYLVILCSAMA